jgi:hypothetical protein
MSQERLNSLVVLCIKKNMIEHINIENNYIISDFASKNARKNCFV